jgi:hypothetical protein
LTYGGGINDRGEIAGQAFDQNTGDTPAFLAIPVTGSQRAEVGGSSAPKITLPKRGAEKFLRLLLENLKGNYCQ